MKNLSGQIKRFAVVGLANTGFGYLLGVVMFKALEGHLDAFLISYLSSFLSIGFSTLMQRRYVFKSANPVVADLKRGYLVYSIVIVLTAVCFKAMIDFLNMNVFVVQFIVLALSWVLSFNLLKNYAFKVKE